MARTISANSLTKLATNLGTEPINIIEIQWVEGGPRHAYADRDIDGGVQGKILDLSQMDAVVQVSKGSDSQQISVVLDDTDGSLKDIIDNNDVHKRSCWVYQWFDGLLLSEKFLIFKGQVSSPIVWNEGDRSLKFDIISKIEDVEVGFSIEEGDFPTPPEGLIGQPWPLCFGTCINVPALRISNPRSGVLINGTGIVDPTLEARIIATEASCCPVTFLGYEAQYTSTMSLEITPRFEIDKSCALEKCQAIDELTFARDQQLAFEHPTLQIFDGDKFPQDTQVTLDIGGAKFTGRFSGTTFTVLSRIHPDSLTLVIPPEVYGLDRCGTCQEGTQQGVIDFQASLTQRNILIQLANIETDFGPSSSCGSDVSAFIDENLTLCAASQQIPGRLPTSNFFWANPGTEVRIDGEEEIIYIANILPSTIERVGSYRTFEGGNEAFITVPPEYYTVRQVDYEGYDVCEIVFDRPLSRRGQGWNDDIYITLTSSVGPNTVDIIQWFIETYTEYDIDMTSFDLVRDKVENYPSHFPLLERKNIITVLNEIAYQARCALWLRDDKFFIRYLPDVPVPADTIAVSDVSNNSLELFHTSTEDLVTKYTIDWKIDYAKDEPNKVILRHNVLKYGTHEKKEFFYIYNIQELVIKAATFWLIRLANTWRKCKFTTPIHKLKLEVFDAVTINLPHIAPSSVIADIENANFNSDTRTMEFDLWTPIKSGTTVPYDFARPADIEQTLLFPTLDERDLGLAGSGAGPSFLTRPPVGHPLAQESGLFQGFSLSCNGNPVEGPVGEGHCRSDHGNRYPSDRGDVKPTPRRSQDSGAPLGGNGANPSPGPQTLSNCCKTAEKALEVAKEARAEAAQAQQPEPGELEDLPPCEDQPCTSVVRVFNSTVDQVARNGGFHSDGCGIPTHGSSARRQDYCFNSRNQAQSFFDNQKAIQESQGDQACIGEEIIVNANVSLAGSEGTCPSGDIADARITGYSSVPT